MKNAVDKLVRFVPGKIEKTKDFGKATLRAAADNDKSQEETAIVYVYQLTYTVYTEYNKQFFVTIEYTKKNNTEPEREGVNYIGIMSYDSNGSVSEYIKIGNAV